MPTSRILRPQSCWFRPSWAAISGLLSTEAQASTTALWALAKAGSPLFRNSTPMTSPPSLRRMWVTSAFTLVATLSNSLTLASRMAKCALPAPSRPVSASPPSLLKITRGARASSSWPASRAQMGGTMSTEVKVRPRPIIQLTASPERMQASRMISGSPKPWAQRSIWLANFSGVSPS